MIWEGGRDHDGGELPPGWAIRLAGLAFTLTAWGLALYVVSLFWT